MSKFTKRVAKSIKVEGNALVIGDGFGFVHDILDLYQTVFVILNESTRLKAKNIVYRDTIDDLHLLPDITVAFIDLKYKDKLNNFENLMIKTKPILLIEGNEILDVQYTRGIYKLGYRCLSEHGSFHQWKKIQ